MTAGAPHELVEAWTPRLRACLDRRCTLLTTVSVTAETPSTQIAARRGALGAVHVACRQTAGRGRLGRAWADTGDDGIALSCTIRRRAPEQLAIAAAVGVARGVEALLARPVGIKWPNDIMAGGRKLAGILVEVVDDRAIIGVGVNVHQMEWPIALRERAISLAQIGLDGRVGRIDVIELVLTSLDSALQAGEEAIVADFAARDCLAGREVLFRAAGQEVSGRVLRVDPLRGLAVEVAGAERWLPAATTSVVEVRR